MGRVKQQKGRKAAFCMVFSLFAVQICYASESERLYRSAYFLGRGDTGIAVVDNHEAIHYNPAGLAKGKGIYKETVLVSPMVELSSATKDLIRKFTLENATGADTLADEIGKNQHIGFYQTTAVVFRRAALGVTVSNQTNLLPYLSAEQMSLPVVSASAAANQVLHFSLAEEFFTKGLYFGTTVKYWQRSVANLSIPLAEASDVASQLEGDNVLNTGTGTGADLGMMYQTQSKRAPFSLGVQVQNVGGVAMTGATPQDKVPDLHQVVNVGAAIEPGTRLSRFKLLLDVRDLGSKTEDNTLKKIHIGAEIAIGSLTGVTGGFHHGYPSVGTYLNLYVLRFDLGMYTEEVGDRIGERPDSRFFLRIAGGF